MDLSFARKRRRRSANKDKTTPPDYAVLLAQLSASATVSPTGIAQAKVSRDEAMKRGRAPEDAATPDAGEAESTKSGSFHDGVADLLKGTKEE